MRGSEPGCGGAVGVHRRARVRAGDVARIRGVRRPAVGAANRQVVSGLSPETVVWTFTNDTAYPRQPITWISYLIDSELYGTRNAGPWVLTNVVFHIANLPLVFSLLLSWTAFFWPSLIVALLFAVHPLQVESVAWVSARKEVLAGTFLLVSLGGVCAVRSKPDPA